MELSGAGLDTPLGEDLDYLIRTLRGHQVGVIDRLLTGLNLPLRAWYPLVVLRIGDGISQREIARKIKLKDAAVGKSIDVLGRAGLIVRAADGGDGRKSIVTLTPKGRRVARKIATLRANLLDAMHKGFSGEEKALFRQFLTRANANLYELEAAAAPLGD